MSIHWCRTPYNQELLPNLTWVTSEKLQEEAQLAEEAQLEAERQEQAWLEEERACTEAEVQRIEAVCKAEEARKAEESQQADALVGSLTGASSNIKVMNPHCLQCTWTNMTCVCSTDSKKRRMACNQCNELKEHCQWPVEGETSQGAGLVIDKGKRKADVTSPHTSKKKKRLQCPSAKALKGADGAPDQVVEHMADNIIGLTVAQWEVLRNFYRFTQSYKTYVEEHFKILASDEEDRDVKGLNEELDRLREEEEESQSQSESGGQTGAGSAGSQA
ncbi:hypothetical protein M404DRAFT_23254 [Pisolithus tinctorius Marx 270]|uniref:Uncharacterized protein n=1 Tax=Pisolithus tinctorius Marx 270 TaxID=870435 RepID=A0A0C3KEG5_PISTI|nr:hypothetical protein M404DRAFT_23254 [Pisolithus tinctorius Marx 270]